MTCDCRPECPNQHQKAGQDRDESPVQPAWRADADQLPHEQSEIEAAGVNQQSLQDIRVTVPSGRQSWATVVGVESLA